MTETTTEVDFNRTYRVRTMPGIAFRLLDFTMEEVREQGWEVDCDKPGCDHDDDSCYVWCEPEFEPSTTLVNAIMVGDDQVHVVEVSDLTPLDEGEFCQGCGQTGCGH